MAILDAAAEAGITFLDTADAYPLGAPLADARPHRGDRRPLAQGPARRFVLATKCFAPTGPSPWDAGNSRQNIMRAIDASLAGACRPTTSTCTSCTSGTVNTPVDESLLALDDLVHAGKVRYVGISNFLAYQLARALGRSEVLGVARFDSLQPRYNLLFRQPERELLPLCAEEQVAVIPYNPLAGGLLTGKHPPTGRPTEGTRLHARQRGPDATPTATGTTGSSPPSRRCDPWPTRPGGRWPSMAVAWVLANPVITSPIIGASRPEQLEPTPSAPSRRRWSPTSRPASTS